jgi:SAM-dependent methyltransferase
VDVPGTQSDDANQTTQQLVDYYDQLADRYDVARFGNSYGRYLHRQERRLLQRWIAPLPGQTILDLACGTGRLLDLATHGVDASAAMVRLAQQKHPQKTIRCGRATNLTEFGIKFDVIFCLHLFMHLPKPEIESVLNAVFAQMQPGGLLIFDMPSACRRSLTGFQPAGWHAGTALGEREVLELAGEKWRMRRTQGVLFFPIHRLPAMIRPAFRPLDDLVGASPLKPWSSYLLYCLERRS